MMYVAEVPHGCFVYWQLRSYVNSEPRIVVHDVMEIRGEILLLHHVLVAILIICSEQCDATLMVSDGQQRPIRGESAIHQLRRHPTARFDEGHDVRIIGIITIVVIAIFRANFFHLDKRTGHTLLLVDIPNMHIPIISRGHGNGWIDRVRDEHRTANVPNFPQYAQTIPRHRVPYFQSGGQTLRLRVGVMGARNRHALYRDDPQPVGRPAGIVQLRLGTSACAAHPTTSHTSLLLLPSASSSSTSLRLRSASGGLVFRHIQDDMLALQIVSRKAPQAHIAVFLATSNQSIALGTEVNVGNGGHVAVQA
mmetsp:Transcript_26433/g.44177  ORF Transcript_26433/g.44177 Transcript_26433/m.44177 type:complete len:308 (-) Transcript_26433:50-973(-)